jgi:hypothetical protein
MSGPAQGVGYSGRPTPQRLEPPMPGAHFSSASSDFKVLGAFFCNYGNLSFSRLVSRGSHGQARARVPDLVGSRLPSPYHFRARIQSFQDDATPFPGDSVLPSASRAAIATVLKIEDQLGGFEETKASISNKLARGTMSGHFFLASLAVLERDAVRLVEI